jgi:hypothetical protein
MAQHDYIIANAAGASFRADINNALAAIVSQNSGPNQPNETYAFQFWAHTAEGLLKQRNAANDGWVIVGTLAATNLGLATLASPTFTGNVTINAQGDLRLADSDSSNWVALQAPATVASNLTLTAPAADGTADQALVTDGAGALSFASRSRLVRGTAVATTSGTSVDFTSIPSWVRRITVLLDSVSTTVPTAEVGLRVGDSGGVATTGYNYYSSAVYYADGVLSAATTEYTTYLGPQWGLSDTVRHATWTLTNISGNVWVVAHNLGAKEDTNYYGISTGGGRVALSGTLDRIRVFTTSGTLDAGTANIIYEG